MTECFCSRCSGDGPSCYEGGGDHDVAANGRCRSCGDFFAWALLEGRMAKAAREGRSCDDHFHRTAAGKAACTTPERYPFTLNEPTEALR